MLIHMHACQQAQPVLHPRVLLCRVASHSSALQVEEMGPLVRGEQQKRERESKTPCCLAHRRDGWHWLCPRCQQASGKGGRSGGGGVFWQCTAAAASCPHRHEEGGGGGGRGDLLLCDKVLFRCCCQHPCYPCGSSLASKCSLLVCWEWERGERRGEAAHCVSEW